MRGLPVSSVQGETLPARSLFHCRVSPQLSNRRNAHRSRLSCPNRQLFLRPQLVPHTHTQNAVCLNFNRVHPLVL